MKFLFSVVFYKFFQFSKYIGNVDDDAYAFKSTSLLCVFISLNLFTLIAYYNCLVRHASNLELSKILEGFIILIIWAVILFIFYKDGKYKIHLEKINNLPKYSGRFGTYITLFYMIGSVALLSSIIWLKC